MVIIFRRLIAAHNPMFPGAVQSAARKEGKMSNYELITGAVSRLDREYLQSVTDAVNNDSSAQSIALSIGAGSIVDCFHTFNWWKRHGYTVKRGEKAVCKCGLWRAKSKKTAHDPDESDGDENGETSMFITSGYLFSILQVERAFTAMERRENVQRYNAMLAEQRKARAALAAMN